MTTELYLVMHYIHAIHSCPWGYDDEDVSAYFLGDACDGVPLCLGEVGDTSEHVCAVGELCSSQRL